MRRALKKPLIFQNFFSVCQVSQSQWFFISSRTSGGCFVPDSFCPRQGTAGAQRRAEPPWPPGATVGLRWIGGVVPVLFSSFVSKHLFPYFIFGGAGQWGPVSLHWESISTFYEMVFRIWFARNEWLSSTSSTKHSWYKWDMHLVSSVFCISRIFVNNCILFLVPLYHNLSLSFPFFLRFHSLLVSVTSVACGLFGLPVLTTALLLCTSLIGQGQLEDENCYLLGEQLLCPEISSPLYAEFAVVTFWSSVLLFNHRQCWWLNENALQSLCKGKQTLGTNSLLA